MSRLITYENVQALGFLDWDRVGPMVDMAFDKQDKQLMGVIFVIAQWVILSKRFGMSKATKPKFFL